VRPEKTKPCARERAWVPGVPSKTSQRYNLLLACDINVGPVAWMIYKENTDAGVFARFLRDVLVPQLTAGVRRTVMCDNLAAHFTDGMAENALHAAGHRLLARPSYWPDMAPIESFFGKIKAWLRTHRDYIGAANFRDAIEMAVMNLTAQDCRGFYQNTRYFVPGMVYKPYLGMYEQPYMQK